MQTARENLSVPLVTQAELQIGGITILAVSHYKESNNDCFLKISHLLREEIGGNSSLICDD